MITRHVFTFFFCFPIRCDRQIPFLQIQRIRVGVAVDRRSFPPFSPVNKKKRKNVDHLLFVRIHYVHVCIVIFIIYLVVSCMITGHGFTFLFLLHSFLAIDRQIPLFPPDPPNSLPEDGL